MILAAEARELERRNEPAALAHADVEAIGDVQVDQPLGVLQGRDRFVVDDLPLRVCFEVRQVLLVAAGQWLLDVADVQVRPARQVLDGIVQRPGAVGVQSHRRPASADRRPQHVRHGGQQGVLAFAADLELEVPQAVAAHLTHGGHCLPRIFRGHHAAATDAVDAPRRAEIGKFQPIDHIKADGPLEAAAVGIQQSQLDGRAGCGDPPASVVGHRQRLDDHQRFGETLRPTGHQQRCKHIANRGIDRVVILSRDVGPGQRFAITNGAVLKFDADDCGIGGGAHGGGVLHSIFQRDLQVMDANAGDGSAGQFKSTPALARTTALRFPFRRCCGYLWAGSSLCPKSV